MNTELRKNARNGFGKSFFNCYYYLTYEFQSESTLYSLPECHETVC